MNMSSIEVRGESSLQPQLEGIPAQGFGDDERRQNRRVGVQEIALQVRFRRIKDSVDNDYLS